MFDLAVVCGVDRKGRNWIRINQYDGNYKGPD